MTRKDKISKAAQNYSDSINEFQKYHTHPQTHPRNAFVNGAEWADKTMIDKACVWLKSFLEGPMGEGLAKSIADEFRKAMEE